MLPIARNQPIPRPGRRRACLYPFGTMSLRDSFTIEAEEPLKKRHSIIVCAARKRIRIATRCNPHSVTVWRIG